MRPQDLSRFRTVARPHLHPDGHRVCFDVAQIDLDEDRYLRRVWLWDGEARPFTAGPGDSNARWSPGGSRLAFLRQPGKDPAQLAVMPAEGGEAEIITDFSLGVNGFEWSPGSDRIAVEATTWLSDWAELDDEERARKPRRVEHAVYRFDNQGWRHDRRTQVWLVDPSGGAEPERLTDGEADEIAPVWSPDGTRVALLTVLDDPKRMAPGTDILEVERASGAVTIRHRQGGWSALAYRPDDTLLAVGDVDPMAYPSLSTLWSIEADEPRDRTGHLDRSIWSFLLPPEMARPVWLEDGYLVGWEDSGRLGVVRMDAAGGCEPVIEGDRYVTGFAAAEDGSRIVFTATDPTNPGELYELTAEGERPLTTMNDEFRGSVPMYRPHHLRVTSDGVDIDVWVVLPDGAESVPVLLNIHGGPASQYGFSFFDEFQVYAGAGFGVVACNPRGSSGRGLKFLRAVVGEGWGEVDVADVAAALEGALAAHPRLDAARVGIMGGSYGGFLTAWMTGRDHGFASAVVERALINWESFAGTSDIAPHFSAWYLGAVPPGGRDVLGAVSPSTYADRITTPTLIIHSEEDFRCPIEQAEQLFMTLLRNGVDVSLLRFPGESHELSRSGKPRHRVERFDAILDWHRRYLGPGPESS